MVSKQRFTRLEISPFFRINGYLPDTKEYQDLIKIILDNGDCKFMVL